MIMVRVVLVAVIVASHLLAQYSSSTPTADFGNNSLRTLGNIETPNPRLMHWQTALGAGLARAIVIGDSVGQGFYATNINTQGWVGLMRSRVATAWPDRGGMLVSNVAVLAGSTIVTTGSWTSVTGWGVSTSGATPYSAGSSATATLSCGAVAVTDTANQMCDTFEVYYLTNTDTANGFTAVVDGGAPATYGATTTASLAWAKATISAGALGAHTLVLTAPSSGKMYLYSIVPLATGPATGIAWYNDSISGSSSSVWCANPAQNIGWMASASPNLVIVALGVNDWQSMSAATWGTNLASCVSWIQSNTSASILLVDTYQFNASLSSGTFANYYAQTRAVAQTYQTAYINISDRWGTYAQANANGLMFNTLHPNTAGHADYAGQVLQTLFRTAWPRSTPTFRHLGGSGTATISLGVGAGNSPTLNSFSGTDFDGFVFITAGSSATGGAIVTISFQQAYTANPSCVVSAGNPQAMLESATKWYPLVVDTTHLYIWAQAGLTNGAQYKWAYHCADITR